MGVTSVWHQLGLNQTLDFGRVGRTAGDAPAVTPLPAPLIQIHNMLHPDDYSTSVFFLGGGGLSEKEIHTSHSAK